MDILLILTYGAICFAVFRVFKVPANAWTLTTAVLGGVAMLSLIMLTMNFNHPFTNLARTYTVTTPILPSVSGRVVSVDAEPNTPLKEGDILFTLEDTPFRERVAGLEAQMKVVEGRIKGYEEERTAAGAQLRAAKAALTLAQGLYDDDLVLVKKGVRSQTSLDQRKAELDQAANTVQAVEAQVRAAQARLDARLPDGRFAELAQIEANLANANWELEQTVVHAPADGYVTQVALRPGMVAVPFPLRPVMVFIPSETRFLVASFNQIAAQRLKAGQEVEMAFHGIPGSVFTSTIVSVLPAMAAGQIEPTGTLIAPEARQNPGRIVAVIDLPEEVRTFDLPGGSMAAVATYSEHWHPMVIIRKILLRMKAWQYYLIFEH